MVNKLHEDNFSVSPLCVRYILEWMRQPFYCNVALRNRIEGGAMWISEQRNSWEFQHCSQGIDTLTKTKACITHFSLLYMLDKKK